MALAEKKGYIQPVQLSLFQFDEEVDSHLSNIIDLYDAIPRFLPAQPRRRQEDTLEPVHLEFEYAGKRLFLTLKPALRPNKRTGKMHPFFPGQREELIEHALRKIATEPGNGFFLTDKDSKPSAGLRFSYYGLQKELTSTGHSFSIAELMEGVQVLKESSTILESEDKSVDWHFHALSEVIQKHPVDSRGRIRPGRKSYAVAIFNLPVTQAIQTGQYRAYNYQKLLSYKWFARRIRLKLSLRFTQASSNPKMPYTITLAALLRDTGLPPRSRLRDSVKALDDALSDMVRDKDLRCWDRDLVRNGKYNRINPQESKYSLYVSESFAQEQLEANMRSKRNLFKLEAVKRS